MRKRNTTRNNNTVPGFLSKTYKILENPEYIDIISWNEDGKAFKVKKPNEFAEKVLPKYFKTNNFASFVRQLNMYDFHKLRHDSEENEWRHRLFRRGYPNLLCEIKRKINETQMQDAVVTQKEQKKITSDTQYLLKEMVTLKQKQESLEKACSVLIAQNTQILGENKLLWGEINKKKEKSQKKIEKLLSLVLNYLGPKQIPELAFLNGKKPNDYLKQEDLSDNENDEHHDMISGGSGNRSNLGNSKRWDGNDIGNSINSFQFNNNNSIHGLNNNFNGGGLNASNLLNSQNGNQLSMVPNEQGGEQFAQKLLDKLMKNLKNNHNNKQNPQEMQPQKGLQITNFVDNYHKSNQDLLSKISNFMNSQGGTQDLSSLELNNQITQATMNPSSSQDLLQKRGLKKAFSNPFNPNMSLGIGNDEMENENMLLKSKRQKKEEDAIGNSRFGSVNPAFGNFNFEEFLNHHQLNGSNAFNNFGDMNGLNSINNKTSLDFTKIFNNNDFQPLALPHSTTNQPSSPLRKKPRNIINNMTSVGNDNSQLAQLLNKSNGLNDSIPGFNINGNPNASTLYNNPHQQNQQWEEFHKFITDQKIEESNNNTQSNTNNSTNLNNNNNNTNNNSNMIDGCNEEFLAKESVNKLNESMI